MAKYTLLLRYLLERGLAERRQIVEPAELDLAAARRVHTAEYLHKLTAAGLSPSEERRLGVPWSPRLLRRSRLASQGTLDAAGFALTEGLAGNLAGGTHHAFADRGEGFCVLNDVAIAIRTLQADGRIARALVIDLDVHQGNGTAAIFDGDASVFTFSIHGERNYPALKQRSSLDIALPDGTDDAQYLRALEAHLPDVLDRFAADVVFYLAGVDVAAGDRYGRFVLSDAGISRREQYVIETVRGCGLPLAVLLAGGYAHSAERTAALHTLVFEQCRRYEARGAAA